MTFVGAHPSTSTQYGHRRLRELLRQSPWLSEASSAPILAQASSIGSASYVEMPFPKLTALADALTHLLEHSSQILRLEY